MMKLDPKKALRKYIASKKKEMTKKLTKEELAFVVLGFFILFLLIFLCYRIPRLKELVDTYPYLMRIVYFLIIILVVLAYAFFKKSPKCPACKSKYDDFKLHYDTGMIECVKCSQQVPFVSVYKKDEREFILNTILNSQNITEEDKIKIKKLKSQIEFSR